MICLWWSGPRNLRGAGAVANAVIKLFLRQKPKDGAAKGMKDDSSGTARTIVVVEADVLFSIATDRQTDGWGEFEFNGNILQRSSPVTQMKQVTPAAVRCYSSRPGESAIPRHNRPKRHFGA